MHRALRSLALGAAIGGILGLYLGWTHFPLTTYRSHLAELETSFRDDYTIMIAAGYALDNDPQAALQRLSHLRLQDPPQHIQELAEHVIATSARDIHDIRLLVNLARGLGRLSPAMQPFLQLDGSQP